MRFFWLTTLLLFSVNSFSIQVVEYSTPEKTFIDIDEDNEMDLIISQTKNGVAYFFNDQSTKKVINNIRKGKSLIRDEYHFVESKFKLIKRSAFLPYLEDQMIKAVETFYPNKSKVILLVDNVQKSDPSQLLVGLNHNNPWQLLSREIPEDQYVMAMDLLNYSCREFSIHEIFKDINIDMFMKKSYRKLKLENYLEFDGCENACPSGQRTRTCPDGRRINCGRDIKKVMARGLKKRLKCLSKINKTITAELVGLLVSNNLDKGGEKCLSISGRTGQTGCKRVRVVCENNEDLGSLGEAISITADNWPELRISKLYCQSNGNAFNEEEMIDSLIHEMIHLAGYNHGEHPEYAYSCSLACKKQDTHRDADEFRSAKNSAKLLCSNSFQEEGFSEFELLREVYNYDNSDHLFHQYMGIASNPEYYTGDNIIQDVHDFFRSAPTYSSHNPVCNEIIGPNSTQVPEFDRCFENFLTDSFRRSPEYAYAYNFPYADSCKGRRLRGPQFERCVFQYVNRNGTPDQVREFIRAKNRSIVNQEQYASYMTKLFIFSPDSRRFFPEGSPSQSKTAVEIIQGMLSDDEFQFYQKFKSKVDSNGYIGALRLLRDDNLPSSNVSYDLIKKQSSLELCRVLISENLDRTLPQDIRTYCSDVL